MTTITRGTTPALSFNVAADLRACDVYLTFAQNGREILTKRNAALTIEESAIGCKLTQAETFLLYPGLCNVQARFVDESGNAGATKRAELTIEDVDKGGVITYGQSE